MNADGRRVPLGRIVGFHGVRGALRLESWTQPRARIFEYVPWLLILDGGEQLEFATPRGQAHGKGLRVELPGIDSREQAQDFLGAQIMIAREQLPKLDAGEYYWTDLEGLEVVTPSGVELGRVHHLLATGANDVLVVRDDSGRERLLPYVPGQYVKEVDLAAARMVVDWDPEF